jgi:hypothetical protein
MLQLNKVHKNFLYLTLFLFLIYARTEDIRAIPAFAKQMNMPCSACHFQQFPELNDFGRAFKASGYTMLSPQQKEAALKGDDLSLPITLNASIFASANYVKQNGTDPVIGPYADLRNQIINDQLNNRNGQNSNNVNLPSAFNPNNTQVVHPAVGPGYNGAFASTDKIKPYTANRGQYQYPATDSSLFIGGHAGEHVGFFFQANMTTSPSFGGLKVPVMYDFVGDTKVGVIPFATTGDGVAYGYDNMATGFSGTTPWSQAGALTLAGQYMNTYKTLNGYSGQATGVAAVLKHEEFWINASKWTPSANTYITGSATDKPTADYLRAAYTPHIGSFSAALGGQIWGGKAAMTDPNTSIANSMMVITPKASAVDAQAQGVIGSIPVGIYLSHFDAPGTPQRYVIDTNANATTLSGVPLPQTFPSGQTTTTGYIPGTTQSILPSGVNSIYFPWNQDSSGASQTRGMFNYQSKDLNNGLTLYRINGRQNLFNPNPYNKGASQVGFKVGVVPQKWTIMVNYLWATTGTSKHGEITSWDLAPITSPLSNNQYILAPNGQTIYTKYKDRSSHNAFTLGTSYSYTQNIRFEINDTTLTGTEFRKGGFLDHRQTIDPGNLQRFPQYGANAIKTASGGNQVPAGNHTTSILVIAGF